MKKIVLSALALSFMISSCVKEDQDNSNTTNNSSSSNNNSENITAQLSNYGPEVQTQTVNSDRPFTFTTAQGNEINFSSNSFVDVSGNPITGNVDISVTEITNVSDMILSGMMTNSNQGPLSSQGEFEITVSQNGEELALADGKTFTIENPNLTRDTAMVGWNWEENENDTTITGEWIQNEFDENNDCSKMTSLYWDMVNNLNTDPANNWKYIKPFRDYVFEEADKQFDLNGKTIMVDQGMSINAGDVDLRFYNYNDLWKATSTTGGYFTHGDGPVEHNGNTDWWHTHMLRIDPFNCELWLDSLVAGDYVTRECKIDPNKIQVRFSKLSWCNIDKLLNEYGALFNCNLNGSFPNHATVKCIFKDLNGATSCYYKNGKFVASQLPDGLDIQFVVYFKDGDEIKYGTQVLSADNEMQFDESNLKTLSDVDALVEEINKLTE